jgi:NADH dehydrogenase FAD-containing subunit
VLRRLINSRASPKQLRRRLAGQKLEPFVYRAFGSLVSLGKYSTVGSLMGFLVGKNIFTEGYFARLMYRALYKMHEYACRRRQGFFWLACARDSPGARSRRVE